MNNTIRVNTWEECEREILNIENDNSFALNEVWFRGLPNSTWALTSTLERRVANLRDVVDTYHVAEYYRLMWRIKPEIETFMGSTWEMPSDETTHAWTRSYDKFRNLLESAYSFMAHLRHHGFPSPLLDWTRSPYFAAYFAFAKPERDSDEVAIYVYSERPNNLKVGGSDSPSIFPLGPLVKTHKRHFRQKSRYTVCAEFDQTNGWCFKPHQTVFDLGRTDQDVLRKIVIPKTERIKVLNLFDKFNLNAFSLFDSEEGLMETLACREIDLKTPKPAKVNLPPLDAETLP